MLEVFQSFKVFISSPGDVPVERQIAEEVIRGVSHSCRDTLGIQVEVVKWEQLPPLTPESTIQDIIIERLSGCNGFILILNRRYGTVEPGQSKSNTEREIDVALRMLSEGGRTMFLSYFKELPPNDDRGSQEKKVRDLRAELTRRGVFYKSYKTPEEFRDRLTHDLYHTILKFQVSTAKRRLLNKFWQLGIAEGATHPQLALIYPPVDRHFMRREDPDRIWLKRLVPHIVFEDFKALQKVEKTLRLIGFRDFEFFSVAGAPPDIQDRNRLWICLPRNEPSQHQLALYKNRALFEFVRRQPLIDGRIRWHCPHDPTKSITVESPLGKYLSAQRGDAPGGEWQTHHGRVFAKDFAILARFSDKRERAPMSSGTLKDYFIAGIRGLGTWGAAWFIDRRYNALHGHMQTDDCDIQMLLEVTYKNERIHDVRDVSGEPESYFRDENSMRTVRARIKEHC